MSRPQQLRRPPLSRYDCEGASAWERHAIGIRKRCARPRSGRWRAEWLSALKFRIRRTVLMTKRLYSIRAYLQLQVDVRIGEFVAWRAVSHDQKGGIVVGLIQKVVTIASARRECDAGA